MGGVSITVFEALLSDTPVIVTPESGEVIEKIGAGKIIEYGNIEQLKTAMIDSLEDKETTSAEIRRGQEYIKSNLQWSTVSDKIISVYEKVIGTRQ